MSRAAINKAKALELLSSKASSQIPQIPEQQISTSSQQSQQISTSMQQINAGQSQKVPGQEGDNARKRKAKASMNLDYCEYNLSTLVDTKGGFFASEETKKTPRITYEIPPSLETQCVHCDSIDIDHNYAKYFDVLVCKKCIGSRPEAYSLLTKTECRVDYLLTESELRDTTLPFWEKPNPLKSSYNNMMLYLRSQVETFAFKKWGSPAQLDAEFDRREALKTTKKEQKFKSKLNELRKKTLTSTWTTARNVTRHEHEFGPTQVNGELSSQTCLDCGFTYEFEEL